MGQFVLGLRSLAVKLAVFFVLAALLAWILGGTLWPRPQSTHTQGVVFAGKTWSWRLTIGPRSADDIRWQLVSFVDANKDRSSAVELAWREVAGPLLVDDRMILAGRGDDGTWKLMIMDGSESIVSHAMPDRLAVEQQLARVQAGLPIQDEPTILQQRRMVIDPGIDPGIDPTIDPNIDPGMAEPMNADTADP